MKKKNDKKILGGLVFAFLILGSLTWIIAQYVKFYAYVNRILWMAIGVVALILWLGLIIGMVIYIRRFKK